MEKYRGVMATTHVDKHNDRVAKEALEKTMIQNVLAKNKRNINPDEKLARVFGSKKAINMFEMTKKVSTHLTD